jgi:tape measure domain-containing protein
MDQQIRYTVSANDLISQQLNGMNNQANTLERTMSGLGGTIAGVFGIYQVTNFVNKTIEAGTKVENATTGLTTLLKNSWEAGEVVRQTMADAAATPFAFEGLLDANKALISTGVSSQRAREDVLNLANAIASTGGGDAELQRMVVNMQQISNTGKATAMDIKQFAFAGVNIYKVLADATGQPIAKVKEMEVTYDMLTMALKKAHEQGGIYYNGLEGMAQNTSVKISALGDKMFIFMNNLFTASKPLIDGVIDSIDGLVLGMSDLFNWFVKNKEVVYGLGAGLTFVGGAMLINVIRLKALALWTGFATTSMIAQTFTTGALTAGFAGASTAGMVLAGTMALINAVNPFAWIVVGVAAFTAGIVYAWNKFEGFRGAIVGSWEVIKQWGTNVMNLHKGIGDILHGNLTQGMERIKSVFEDSGEGTAKAWNRGFNKGVADFNFVPLNEKIDKSIETINERVAKGFYKDEKGYNTMFEAFSSNLDKKVKAGLLTEDAKQVALGKIAAYGVKSEKDGNISFDASTKSETKNVKANKAVIINVSIGNLINDFQIKTTNMYESANVVKDIVTKALTGAINDSQIVAGNN